MTLDLASFTNEPPLDLARAQQRDDLTAALAELDRCLPLTVPPTLRGVPADVKSWFTSLDPSRTDRVVAKAGTSDESLVDRAVDELSRCRETWSSRTQQERAETLIRAAALLRDRRLEACALLVRECGKTWPEADAEYCEAVDFLEYYARASLALTHRTALHQVPDETNTIVYSPRGVTAVIAPWNFPVAIALGMSAGALVMGNAVALKPAEQTPATGLFLHRLLCDAGVPAAALALLPGAGQVGAQLVRHPAVDTIAFTGSRDVGLGIVAAAGRTHPAQREMKKVIAEMGGKNCLIVDETVNVDDCVEPILRSAFAFAGQKCSAASRVLVHGTVYDALVERVAHATQALKVGSGDEFDTDVTALIEPSAQQRVAALIDQAAREGTIAARSSGGPADGWFLPATVVCDLPAESSLLREEIFGPMVTIERYTSLDNALARVDALPYALTGGILSRSKDTVARVIERSPVGNLYVNRKTTGAFVGRQPFGGSRMSGTGIKAGSAEYVTQFANTRVVCTIGELA